MPHLPSSPITDRGGVLLGDSFDLHFPSRPVLYHLQCYEKDCAPRALLRFVRVRPHSKGAPKCHVVVFAPTINGNKSFYHHHHEPGDVVTSCLCVRTIAYCPISQADHLGPLPNSPRMYPDGILVSTISEWLVVMTFLAFTTSFAAEFRKFKLTLKLEYIAEPNSSRAQLKTPAESHGETSLKEESSTSQQ
ncbi:hypothetical protein HPB49_017027 [Dermacentor silvarum]|uniref:Uncharacterized protein n=1 Tax=Dermacentor silvarum TaxID=543639 RepID=A0ACB8CYR0_DERSI|nr:hypothetical protein HPB49_017027 [Dermacentor silvarum]